MKKTSATKQLLFGGILFATVLAIGCNNSEEKKEAETPAPAPTTEAAPATATPTPPDSTTRQKKDTASVRPTKTPN